MATRPELPVDSLQEKLRSLEQAQRAALNILDDFDTEKKRLQGVQRATLNILEDFDAEKHQLEEVQRATVNILEDFDTEKKRLQGVQRATLNILEDFDGEKNRLQTVQSATLNILEDFNTEKVLLEGTQRAVLNILDDFDVEKAKVATVNQQLEAANKELEAFTYSVAHDLRAPLRHIDGFSRILAEAATNQLDPQARHYLTRILDATQMMSQLVEDLLNLSRVGRKELILQATGLNSLVDEVLAGLKPEVEGRQIEWKIAKLPFVEADPALLRQVLANLLANAVKFTRSRERAVIEVGALTPDAQPVIFVRDNGVGFSMKYADKLFGIFQRLHRQEDFEGTGIGLATVQRIIHKHGGRVWAEAEVNRGATFYFTLGQTPNQSPEPTR